MRYVKGVIAGVVAAVIAIALLIAAQVVVVWGDFGGGAGIAGFYVPMLETFAFAVVAFVAAFYWQVRRGRERERKRGPRGSE